MSLPLDKPNLPPLRLEVHTSDEKILPSISQIFSSEDWFNNKKVPEESSNVFLFRDAFPSDVKPVGNKRRREEDENVWLETKMEFNHYEVETNEESDSEGQGTFVCKWNNCQETFSTRTGLATHCSSHLKSLEHQTCKKRKGELVCRWNSCGKILPSLRELGRHLSSDSHIGQTPFLSRDCKKVIEKKYACSYEGCGKTFGDSSNRKKHEKTHETNRERFYCTALGCTKNYSTKTDLRLHMKVHSGDFTHKCSHPLCGKAFVRVSELYAHERTHDRVYPHNCSICGKGFKEKAKWNSHLRLHNLQQA